LDFRLSLIPLEVAVKAVYEQIYGEFPREANELAEEELNAIASAMVARVPIYEYDSDPDITARPLIQADLAGVSFGRGGKHIIFPNGRVARVAFGVSVDAIAEVVRVLKQQKPGSPKT
jgi:hypothetical protein